MASSEPKTTRLSARQIECLTRIAASETSAEIALALGVSRRTIDEYVGAACARLGVRGRSPSASD